MFIKPIMPVTRFAANWPHPHQPTPRSDPHYPLALSPEQIAIRTIQSAQPVNNAREFYEVIRGFRNPVTYDREFSVPTLRARNLKQLVDDESRICGLVKFLEADGGKTIPMDVSAHDKESNTTDINLLKGCRIELTHEDQTADASRPAKAWMLNLYDAAVNPEFPVYTTRGQIESEKQIRAAYGYISREALGAAESVARTVEKFRKRPLAH